MRTMEARSKPKTVANTAKAVKAIKRQNNMKRGGQYDAGQVEELKKEHEIEIITLKKNARKAQIEFFKEKSEHAMRVFKQEQIYMVEEYVSLKKRDTYKEMQLLKQEKEKESGVFRNSSRRTIELPMDKLSRFAVLTEEGGKNFSIDDKFSSDLSTKISSTFGVALTDMPPAST